MDKLSIHFEVHLPEDLFLKDPRHTELGKRIIQHSVRLILQEGFEHFTFKKLANELSTAESSIYRYFENKYHLLFYLVNWYWYWQEYLLVFNTRGLHSKEAVLKQAIKCLLSPEFSYDEHAILDMTLLRKLYDTEADKALHHFTLVQRESPVVFSGLQTLVGRMKQIIESIQPEYPYAERLSLLILTGFHSDFVQQLSKSNPTPDKEELLDFAYDLVIKTIN